MRSFAQSSDSSMGDEGWAPLTRHFSGRHAVILGGAGFLGAHLSDRLAELGAQVTVVDSFLTSRPDTVRDLRAKPHIEVVEGDITHEIPVSGPVDFVLNFASPASPVDYVQLPLETLRVGSIGTENGLQLAQRTGAIFMTASTSEVYGDPAVSPQPEGYWGHVNPIGPRSMYDESKRYAEAITMAYHRMHNVQVRMPRIFNTYGPGMRSNDGRAVPSFISSAIHGEPILIHGDGLQTRSLCHVVDLVEGLLRLLASDHNGPVNLGNTHEVSMLELAATIIDLAGSRSEVRHIQRTGDDPQQRRPDLGLANRLLGFQPQVDTETGLRKTIAWFREHEVAPIETEQITISLAELEQEDVPTPYTPSMSKSA